IRRWLRLAEFHAADRGKPRRRRDGPQPWHDAHGSPLREMRRASGPCLPRWSRANGPALLHQLAGTETRSGEVTTLVALKAQATAARQRATSFALVRKLQTLIRITRRPRHVLGEKNAPPVALIASITASV